MVYGGNYYDFLLQPIGKLKLVVLIQVHQKGVRTFVLGNFGVVLVADKDGRTETVLFHFYEVEVKVNLVQGGATLKGTLVSYDGEQITLNWTERVPKPSGKGKMNVDKSEVVALSDVSKIVLDFKF